MITVKLPIVQQKILENGELHTEKTEEEVQVDFSVYAEMRWEKEFPQQAEKEGLFEYIERLNRIKKLGKNAHLQRELVLSMTKVLYCLIESNWTFKEFAQKISIQQPAFIKKINEILELAVNSSAEKN